MSNYLDWSDLLEEEDSNDSPQSSTTPLFENEKKSLADLLQMDQVSDELKHLIEHHQTLEQEMDQLLGRSKAEENSWDSLRFPMPVHTAKSRLKDKQTVKAELLQAEQKKRWLEQSKLKRKQEEKKENQAKALKMDQLIRKKIEHKHKQQRQQKLDQLKREALSQQQLQRQRNEALQQERQQRLAQQRQDALKRIAAEQQRIEMQKQHAQQVALENKQRLADYLLREERLKQKPVDPALDTKKMTADKELEQRQNRHQERVARRKEEERKQQLNDEKRRQRALQKHMDKRAESARWGF
mgnify:CR=1 FL=1